MYSITRLAIISPCEHHMRAKHDNTYCKPEKYFAFFALFFPYHALIVSRWTYYVTPTIGKKFSTL